MDSFRVNNFGIDEKKYLTSFYG